MKALLFLFFLVNSYAFSQCPQSGLKIQSKECQEPKALSVSSVACMEMKVKWVGNKGQTYILNAGYGAPQEAATSAKVSEVTNDNGNYSAVINALEGVTVKWNVQSVCVINGAKFYSAPVNGSDTYIPICHKEKESAVDKNFQAFPNPTTGNLLVEYTGKADNNIVLNVFDLNGKKMMTQNVKSINGVANQYKLDLHSLAAGTYTLEMVSGSETQKTKVVLMRDK